MSNEKIKSENYTQFGGINSKASPYLTTPMEFLDLTNLDFQTPGSLSERWGSTMYVGQTFPGQINALTEFTRLDGSSYVIIGHSGGIWSGATTGNSQGLSMAQMQNNFLSFLKYQPETLGYNPPSVGLLPIYGPVPIYGDYSSGMNANQGPSLFVSANPMSDNTLSTVTFQNYLFAADGKKFFKYNGATTSLVGLPPPVSSFISAVAPFWSTATSSFDNTTIYTGLTTGSIAYYMSYVNDRGFEGQIWPVQANYAVGANAASLGGSVIISLLQFEAPQVYNIQSVNLYSYWSTSVTLGMGQTALWDYPYRLVANIGLSAIAGGSLPFGGITTISGATIYLMPLGTTTGGQSSMIGNLGPLADPLTNTYFPLGMSLVQGSTFSLLRGAVTEIRFNPYVPRYLEVFNNQLFLAGFSSTPSTVWFSDIGEPEGYPLTNNFEVRTNDGDVVTAMKTYGSRLMIFKKNSFYALNGDSPQNFYLQEISLQYGCVNFRSLSVFNDKLMFLDRKGAMIYNGANIIPASNKIQPIFDTMNYNSAINTAQVIHDKLRNQVLIGIPINGATLNNVTIVYDYLVDAWTKYDGYSPAVFSSIQGRNNTKNIFYGNYSGVVSWFGPSFLSDNGTGFTTYLKSRFLHDLGESYQKQFRRLYLNIDAPGTTLTFSCNFFQDFGASIVRGDTIVASQFQTRIDFGISAKALAFELANIQTAVPLKIHGFTIESRLQRKV